MAVKKAEPGCGLQEGVILPMRQTPGKTDPTGWIGDLMAKLACELEITDELRQLLRFFATAAVETPGILEVEARAVCAAKTTGPGAGEAENGAARRGAVAEMRTAF